MVFEEVFGRQNGLLGGPLGYFGEAGCPSSLLGHSCRDFLLIWGATTALEVRFSGLSRFDEGGGRVSCVFLGSPGGIFWDTWTPFRVKISLRIRSCVFHNMACRLYGKLIFMLWPFTFGCQNTSRTNHDESLARREIFSCPKVVPVAMRRQW